LHVLSVDFTHKNIAGHFTRPSMPTVFKPNNHWHSWISEQWEYLCLRCSLPRMVSFCDCCYYAM